MLERGSHISWQVIFCKVKKPDLYGINLGEVEIAITIRQSRQLSCLPMIVKHVVINCDYTIPREQSKAVSATHVHKTVD